MSACKLKPELRYVLENNLETEEDMLKRVRHQIRMKEYEIVLDKRRERNSVETIKQLKELLKEGEVKTNEY